MSVGFGFGGDSPYGPSPFGGSGGGHQAGAVVVGSTFRRLTLASAVANSDPGTRLASALTDGGEGVGLSFALTGGWSSTDWTGAWPYLVWPLLGVDGTQINGEEQWIANLLLKVRTQPGDSADASIRFGFANETTIASATVDAFAAGITWTGATRTVHGVTSVNGTAGSVISGTGSTSITQLQATAGRYGTGASSQVTVKPAGLDASNVYVASSTAATGLLTNAGNGAVYLVLTAGRTATTAGTATIAVDAYTSRPERLILPAT